MVTMALGRAQSQAQGLVVLQKKNVFHVWSSSFVGSIWLTVFHYTTSSGFGTWESVAGHGAPCYDRGY